MSVEVATTIPETSKTEQPKQNDKEFNFRAQEAKYERMLAQERAEKERMARELEESRQVRSNKNEDEDDAEPYVDNKRLERKLEKFGKSTKSDIQQGMEEAKRQAKEELKREIWLDNNPDFYDIVQKHAEKFFEKAPHLAETILKMPEGFDRQKLVYHNIKTLGIDQPEPKKSSIQEKVDANRRSPYYKPSGEASPPHALTGDFSDAGKKQAYEQMKKLQTNLRLG